MEQIIVEEGVRDKLNALVDILLDKEYFSYLENAEAYANRIYDFIYSIPTLKHKPTKRPEHGIYYCAYKANANTTYYITFDIVADHYLIKNILSNHTKEYAEYI